MEENEDNKDTKKKYTKFLVFALLILAFTSFAPYLFTQFHSGLVFGERTGQIGDTIGGITTPFLNLLGSILVYLAFRAQIDANDDIREREKDKEKKEKKERDLEIYNKMELLSVDLESMSTDIQGKCDKIKEYYESKRNFPFKIIDLRRTSFKKYSRTLEIDRLSIFKGYKLLLSSHDTNWIKDYHYLYSLLDFFPEFWSNVYSDADAHKKQLVDLITEISKETFKLMDDGYVYLSRYTALKGQFPKMENDPYYVLVNKLIVEFQQLLGDRFVDGKIIDANLASLEKDILGQFLIDSTEMHNSKANFDPEFLPLMKTAVEARRKIILVKELSLKYSTKIEEEIYNQLIVGTEQNISHKASVERLRLTIQTELNKV